MNDRQNDAPTPWTLEDTIDLYGVSRWGGRYFSVNPETQNIQVHPDGPEGGHVDLLELATQLQRRGIQLPILVRFNGILRQRITELCGAFSGAMEELGYQGSFRGVYPIKVNQQRQVVEEIVRHGRQFHFGLEAGSKPELMAVLASLQDPEAPIICNGYKDEEFLEMILLATKMGRNIIPVVEKFTELDTILSLSRRLDIRPQIGLRLKLATPGAGRWIESGGDRSKFGLTITEVLHALRVLEEANLLDAMVLTHFHLGSQITDIRTIRAGIQEAARIYVELKRMGANLKYLDIGGGLAIDYDGTRSTTESSSNYDLQEYAHAVVSQVMDVCDEAEIPHPILISESGRAVAGHHSVLIMNVLGVTSYGTGPVPETIDDDTNEIVSWLKEVFDTIRPATARQAFHDARHYRDEAMSRFRLGLLNLEERAQVENIYWAICRRCLDLSARLEYVPEEFRELERELCHTYFCNLSIFQSIPDNWAIDQLFPILPIHRLGEEPTCRAILADLTCDSDGKIDHFIGPEGVKDVLELHDLIPGQDYYVGVFLVGAYQEILGDLHNLFGDTNAVHVEVRQDGQYDLRSVVKGDTVSEVLHYVQYNAEELLHRMRLGVEEAVRQGRLTIEESAHFLSRYEDNLDGYTYME